MRPEPNDDLTVAGVSDLGRWLARAADLGAEDHLLGRSKRTGKEVVAKLGLRRWRGGHVRYLQQAYAAGRWHAEAAEKSAPDSA